MKKTLILIFCTFIFSVSSADTSNIQNKFLGSIENFLNENFVNTDFSIKSQEHNKPEIGILTIKPLIDNDQDITFLQGSFFTHDGDRETFNLGLGKRNSTIVPIWLMIIILVIFIYMSVLCYIR